MGIICKKGKEDQQLPPTRRTLVPHTTRTFYITLMWKLSKVPCPKIPSPTNYCWRSEESQLKPVFCVNAPAPEALLELRKCNCKTGCGRKSCSSRKNHLVCTELCGCGDICENMVMDKPIDVDETDR